MSTSRARRMRVVGGVAAGEIIESVAPVSQRLTALRAAEPREMSQLEAHAGCVQSQESWRVDFTGLVRR